MHSSGCYNLETNSPFHLKITGISASAQDVSVSRAFSWKKKKYNGILIYSCSLSHLIRHRRRGGISALLGEIYTRTYFLRVSQLWTGA